MSPKVYIDIQAVPTGGVLFAAFILKFQKKKKEKEKRKTGSILCAVNVLEGICIFDVPCGL